MIKADKYYKENINKILTEGVFDENPRPKYKDGTPAHSKFITQVFEEYDISKGEFPIPTLRNTAIKMGINEMLWIYQKQTNSLTVAHEMNIYWWDSWDIGNSTIGDRYGYTVNKYNLLNKLIHGIKNDPYSRRHIMNLWQEEDFKESKGLNPCAYETLWSIRGEYIDLHLNQRSNDYLVAGFINKVNYLSLMMMIANVTGYKCGKFTHYIQNLHIYDRHFEAAYEILNKEPLDIQPTLELNVIKDFYDYTVNDFVIKNIEGITKIKSPLELAI
jgi:thymidylate synthase